MSAGDDVSPVGTPRTGTRLRIIDAAARLYLGRGDALTTIEAIADGAGVSAGTVYRHFGGKRDLEQAMIDEALSRAEDYLQEARGASSPIRRVRAAGDAYFRIAVEYPVATRLFAERALRTAGPHQTPSFATAVTERTRRLVMGVESDLREAMAAGEILSGEAADVLLFLWGAWSGVITLMLRPDELGIDPDAASRALDIGRRTLLLAGADAEAATGAERRRPIRWQTVSPPPAAPRHGDDEDESAPRDF